MKFYCLILAEDSTSVDFECIFFPNAWVMYTMRTIGESIFMEERNNYSISISIQYCFIKNPR